MPCAISRRRPLLTSADSLQGTKFYDQDVRSFCDSAALAIQRLCGVGVAREGIGHALSPAPSGCAPTETKISVKATATGIISEGIG